MEKDDRVVNFETLDFVVKLDPLITNDQVNKTVVYYY